MAPIALAGHLATRARSSQAELKPRAHAKTALAASTPVQQLPPDCSYDTQLAKQLGTLPRPQASLRPRRSCLVWTEQDKPCSGCAGRVCFSPFSLPVCVCVCVSVRRMLMLTSYMAKAPSSPAGLHLARPLAPAATRRGSMVFGNEALRLEAGGRAFRRSLAGNKHAARSRTGSRRRQRSSGARPDGVCEIVAPAQRRTRRRASPSTRNP